MQPTYSAELFFFVIHTQEQASVTARKWVSLPFMPIPGLRFIDGAAAQVFTVTVQYPTWDLSDQQTLTVECSKLDTDHAPFHFYHYEEWPDGQRILRQCVDTRCRQKNCEPYYALAPLVAMLEAAGWSVNISPASAPARVLNVPDAENW